MSTVSSYIFVHDTKIISESKKAGTFNNLQDPTWVLLGNKDFGQIPEGEKIIICKDLPENIENHSKLCSFTGWYALWKNGLIKTDYVNLFEYDIQLHADFNTVHGGYIENKYDFIGYVPLSMKIPDYLHPQLLCSIFDSIKHHHKVDLYNKLREFIRKERNCIWSSTSNCTFSLPVFDQYMKWFEPIVSDISANPMCGHSFERSISFFLFLYDKNIMLCEGLLRHLMKNSHKSRKNKT